MDNIIFLAPYPFDEEIRDGMMQRVLAIDEYCKEQPRTYLQISIRNNLRKEEKCHGQIRILKVNLFLHLRLILKLLKNAKICYVHSIYNLVYLYLIRIKIKNLALDLHGTVPEEQKMGGNKWRATFYDSVEKYAFDNINYAVVVSNSMKKYYIDKYRQKVRYLLKPIYPANLYMKTPTKSTSDVKKDLGIKDDQVVVVYSGNIQAWQNVELMCNIIRENINNPKLYFIILTQKVDYFTNALKEINSNNIIIRSVNPKELSDYYRISNYGFILRDESVVNSVAAPTKLIEYLKYGIIPIVASPNIGDARDLGYEYVEYTSGLESLRNIKSTKNQSIAEVIIHQADEAEFGTLFA